MQLPLGIQLERGWGQSKGVKGVSFQPRSRESLKF